jgi:ABC-type phosphate transport system substrate-binding protein
LNDAAAFCEMATEYPWINGVQDMSVVENYKCRPEVTNYFGDDLPVVGDKVHIIWHAKADKDISKICFYLIDNSEKCAWWLPLSDIENAPYVENIKAGTYNVARPFNIATLAETSEAAQDFITFIMSAEGQAVIESNGYIAVVENAPAFEGGKVSGKIVIAGSSSVTPVMEKLTEAYMTINPNVEIELQQSDSSSGMTSTRDGVCDIGMASRALKDSEIEAGLTPMTIAMDGIAVIVSNDNPVDGLTSEQVRNIYMGEITDWSEVDE